MAQASVKSKVLGAIESLPQDVTYEEVMERLYFLYKVERGLEQAERGDTMSHEEVEKKLKKWHG